MAIELSHQIGQLEGTRWRRIVAIASLAVLGCCLVRLQADGDLQDGVDALAVLRDSNDAMQVYVLADHTNSPLPQALNVAASVVVKRNLADIPRQSVASKSGAKGSVREVGQWQGIQAATSFQELDQENAGAGLEGGQLTGTVDQTEGGGEKEEVVQEEAIEPVKIVDPEEYVSAVKEWAGAMPFIAPLPAEAADEESADEEENVGVEEPSAQDEGTAAAAATLQGSTEEQHEWHGAWAGMDNSLALPRNAARAAAQAARFASVHSMAGMAARERDMAQRRRRSYGTDNHKRAPPDTPTTARAKGNNNEENKRVDDTPVDGAKKARRQKGQENARVEAPYIFVKEPYISAEERYDPAKEQNREWAEAPLHITSFQAQTSVVHQAPLTAPLTIYPQTQTRSHTSPNLELERMVQGNPPNSAQAPYIPANEPYISAKEQNGESPLWYIPQASDLSAQTHTYVSRLPRTVAEEIPKAMTRGTLGAGVSPQRGSERVGVSRQAYAQYQSHFPSVRGAYAQYQLETHLPGVQQQQQQIWRQMQQHAAWPREQHASEVVGDVGGGSGRGAQEDAGRELRAASWILHLLNAAH